MIGLVEGEVSFNFQLFVHFPNRTVYGFHFVLDERAIYHAGILEQITKAFSSSLILKGSLMRLSLLI